MKTRSANPEPFVLPLDAAAATAPTTEHLGLIGGWMLFPDAPRERENYIGKQRVSNLRLKLQFNLWEDVIVPAEAQLALIDFAYNKSPSTEDVRSQVDKR